MHKQFMVFEPWHDKICLQGFQTRSNINWAMQPQNMARDLKFRIQEVDGLCHLFRENKGADQLFSYSKTDLQLFFRICKKQVFS